MVATNWVGHQILWRDAGSAILGRAINRTGDLRPLTVTTISMGVGAALLLAVGMATQTLPQLDWQSWAIVAWLAVVNTAFAFTLWNLSLHTLTATESSVINNTMGVQIPVLAVLFLGEQLTGRQIIGLAVAIIGTLFVQFGASKVILITAVCRFWWQTDFLVVNYPHLNPTLEKE